MNITKDAAVEGGVIKWIDFSSVQKGFLNRGCVLRCVEAQWPYETTVDFMLIDNRNSPSLFSVLVCTGYKAGTILVDLPMEAQSSGNRNGISVEWLRRNWVKWVYEKCDPKKLLIIENYPENISVIGATPSGSRNINI